MSKLVQSDGFSGFWPELFQARRSRGTRSGPRPREWPSSKHGGQTWASTDWLPPALLDPAASAGWRPLLEAAAAFAASATLRTPPQTFVLLHETWRSEEPQVGQPPGLQLLLRLQAPGLLCSQVDERSAPHDVAEAAHVELVASGEPQWPWLRPICTCLPQTCVVSYGSAGGPHRLRTEV